ncbi:MAG TPA: transcriptional regulator [Verrucomicrobiales bacterium]|nr:transcriptional regulator [Verrucomicrobiales bacterium]
MRQSAMLIKTPKEIGLLVRDRRKARRWTQDALAQRLGVSRLWVVQLEQGKSTAQIGLVLRALNELDVPMQVDITPKDPAARVAASGGIDLDNIIRETSTPYRA